MPKSDDPMDLARRGALRRLALAAGGALGLYACGGGDDIGTGVMPPLITPNPAAPTRTWRLGFSPNPARPTVQSVLQGIDLWSMRAELAVIHEEVPWRDLLGGMSADALLARDKVQLVDYLRGKGLGLVFMADPTDGLSRAEEAPQLRSLGRSLAEPAVQRAFREYVLAVERRLQPEILGLAAETNLVRVAAPATLYDAMVRNANDAAAALRAAGAGTTLLTSVQVETAWGVLGGPPGVMGQFTDIARDLQDFSFQQMLGLSSYPYFGWPQPESIPDDYYTRIRGGSTLPVMVIEGGWTSASVGRIVSSPSLQARYVARHAALLDSVAARALVQLVFADLDLASFPPPLPTNLPLFAQLGLVDSDLAPKPALTAWDALYARRLV